MQPREAMRAIAYVTTKGEPNTDLRSCHTLEAETLTTALAAAHQSGHTRIADVYTDSKKACILLGQNTSHPNALPLFFCRQKTS